MSIKGRVAITDLNDVPLRHKIAYYKTTRLWMVVTHTGIESEKWYDIRTSIEYEVEYRGEIALATYDLDIAIDEYNMYVMYAQMPKGR